MNHQVQYLNPDGLTRNPAFSQIVITQGPGKTVYISGQNAVDAQGAITGKGDIETQTEQAMKNLQTVLNACALTFEHLVKLSVFIVQGQQLSGAFQSAQKFLAGLTHPPAVSVLMVAGLAHPDFLIEIEAVAFLPEP